ncbi:carbohydrate ABC transporter substrate-binding protein, CUT1 family [Virgibacillus subterraneus]|uniref:Carbohydrate ABC transporter substrate-binding protein, CUT1 family n=1 Tax=Virgibacillus subterraneus TaxID=621109 RepID=A0A1H9JC30_9BACI|nr:ABC transporter substrate-binding protein [Virgibacillus subterraneus]SEQ84289.1 carbohydrate ABC transporter substrate-binding protein, CUT1 family [Virgibacillus subterraneus]
MKFKKSLLMVLLLSFSAILFACSEDNKSASSEEKVSLDFWVFGATNYESLAEEYEKENPDVEINIKTSELGDHHNSLFTAISAGTGAPDLAMIEVDQLDRYREAQDRFVNLYDLGAEDIKDQYLDWKWNGAENGEGDFLFGLPTDIGPKAMYYHTDVFEEAGLPTDPDKVSELISTSEAFADAAGKILDATDKPMVDSMEMAFRANMDALQVSYFNRDDELLLSESDNGVKEAYDYAVELDLQGYVGSFEMWTPEWANALNKGGFGVEMAPAWLKGYMTENAPEGAGKWRVTTLPTQFAGNWGGSYIAIPSETEYSEEAYEFSKWLLSPENQLESFVDSGLFPSAPEVYEMEEFKNNSDEYFGGQNTAKYFAEAAKQIPEVYKGPKYVTVNNEILTALRNVQEGGDPEKEWEDAVTRIEGLLKK